MMGLKADCGWRGLVIVALALLWHTQAKADDGFDDALLSHVETRQVMEKKVEENGFGLLPHKPNYILPITFNSRPNQSPWTGFPGAGPTPVQRVEFKFQMSIKVPLMRDIFAEDDVLYVGYTQKSFWQMYNNKLSSPFRDTNFNPELFYRIRLNEDVAGMQARTLTLGFEHESNGRAEPLSKSWNRLYGAVVAERGNLGLGMKLWYRVPEDAAVDNNPDIHHYLGYGELYAYYESDEHVFGMMFRPAWDAGFKHGIQLDWAFPLVGKLRGYVQYYNGYGESLIDYNHYNNTLGVGVILNNWL